MQRFYGVRAHDGQPPCLADYRQRTHPADRKRAFDERWRLVGPDGIGVVCYRVVHDKGETSWVLCRATDEVDASGALLTGQGLTFDVTTARGDAEDGSVVLDARSRVTDRIAALLMEAHHLAAEVGSPALTSALSVGLITIGQIISRELLDDVRTVKH